MATTPDPHPVRDAAFPQALCTGESMAVLLPDRQGPLAEVDLFRLTFGGAESNVACDLARLGIPTAWASRVGDDPLGRQRAADPIRSR